MIDLNLHYLSRMNIMNMNLIHNNHDICVKHNHLRHDINGQYKNYFIYLKAYACVRARSANKHS